MHTYVCDDECMNMTRKTLSTLAGLALILGLGGGGFALSERVAQAPVATTTQPLNPVPSDDLIISGAVIRFTENGPRWHINDDHVPVGLIDTTVEPFINTDGFLEFALKDNGVQNSNPVVSMTISPDETLTARGVIGGASGGVSAVRVRFSKPSLSTPGTQAPLNLNLPAHYGNVEGDNSNVWITLVHLNED